MQRRSLPELRYIRNPRLVWFLAVLEQGQRIFAFTCPADELGVLPGESLVLFTVGKNKSPEVAVDVSGSHGLCEVAGTPPRALNRHGVKGRREQL